MLVQSLHKADSLGLEQRNQHIKLNFLGDVVFILKLKFVANANIAPHQSAQVIIQSGTRYVEFFSSLSNLIFGSVHSAFSGFRLDFRSGSGFGLKKCEGLVSTMFRQQAAKYPCEPSGRDPGVFHSRCQRFNGHMSHSSVLLGRQILRSAPHLCRVLNFCKLRTQYNKHT